MQNEGRCRNNKRNKAGILGSRLLQVVDYIDGPCRIRTYNQRIMSPLL